VRVSDVKCVLAKARRKCQKPNLKYHHPLPCLVTAPVISVVLGAVRPLDSDFRICLLICQLKQSSQYVDLRKINDDGADDDDVSTGGLYKKLHSLKQFARTTVATSHN